MGIDWNYVFTSFTGRIPRQTFWIGAALVFFANVIGQSFIAFLFGHGLIGNLLSLVVWLALAFAGFAVMVKRCHDRDKSGWWSLLSLVPLVGLVWALIDLGILEGTHGANDYGPDPRERGTHLAADAHADETGGPAA